MLDVYAFATPNSVKVPIALEELGLDYRLHAVNIRQGAQRAPEFVALNPNGKVPVLVDSDGDGGPIILSESAAILVYLAEKAGRLLPRDGIERARVFEQLFFHASGLGPAFGNAGYFRRLAPEPLTHAIDRFGGEAERTLGVLDARLAQTAYAAGDELTIADFAHFGWLWRREFADVSLEAYPHVERWFSGLAARPGVQRGIERVTALASA